MCRQSPLKFKTKSIIFSSHPKPWRIYFRRDFEQILSKSLLWRYFGADKSVVLHLKMCILAYCLPDSPMTTTSVWTISKDTNSRRWTHKNYNIWFSSSNNNNNTQWTIYKLSLNPRKPHAKFAQSILGCNLVKELIFQLNRIFRLFIWRKSSIFK